MELKTLKLDIRDHIAWLIINRPDKLNAMNQVFFREMQEAFIELSGDESVRVIVIRAEGRNFTSGLDLIDAVSMMQGDTVNHRLELHRKIKWLQESFNVVERCPKPVIAVVHGACIGAGVDLTSACDIRLASADARFAVRETKMAIVADLGTLQRLSHIVGQGLTRELVFTGRDFDAGEAAAMGFVNRVLPDADSLLAEAEKMALEIAANPPLTVAGAKEVLNFSRDHDLATGLEYVAQKNAAILISNDLAEAMTAFMQKRRPEFKGR